MRIALVGYGRMGREIEAAALRRGHTVSVKIDHAEGVGDQRVLDAAAAAKSDVAIEFSLPAGLLDNLKRYKEFGLPCVIGTTGWNDRKAEALAIMAGSKGGMVYGSNFSVGAHLFFALVEAAGRLVSGIEDYDAMMYELHHNQKKDSPSGTALTAADRLLRALPRKKRIVTEALDRQIEPDELHVASVRGGTIAGTHTLLLDSAADTIEITHNARSRGGFALGAVLAAEWVVGKQGVFSVDEFIADFLRT